MLPGLHRERRRGWLELSGRVLSPGARICLRAPQTNSGHRQRIGGSHPDRGSLKSDFSEGMLGRAELFKEICILIRLVEFEVGEGVGSGVFQGNPSVKSGQASRSSQMLCTKVLPSQV